MATKTRRKMGMADLHFKEILKLREEGYSYREITARLNITSGTVNVVVTAYNAGFESVRGYKENLAVHNGFDNVSHYVRVRNALQKAFVRIAQINLEKRIIPEGLFPNMSQYRNNDGFDISDKPEPTYSNALEQLRPYLDTLTIKQRERLVAYKIQGLSLEEIAKRDGCTSQNIYYSIEGAIKKLKDELVSDGKTLEDFAD